MAGEKISRQTQHASCVAVGDFAVLIRGASGTGKSGLALELMAYGATLVADDQTILRNSDSGVIAECPAAIHGRIEARGVGILAATAKARAMLRLVVDMDGCEHDRLPQPREIEVLGCTIPLLYRTTNAHFAAAILQYLKGGRYD